MKLLISGLGGHMGRELANMAKESKDGFSVVAGVDKYGTAGEIPCYPSFAEAPTDVDMIVDFSHPSVLAELLQFAVANRIPAVIATTGFTPAQKDDIAKAAKKIPIFYAANYSVGIAVLIDLAKRAVAAFPNAEIEIVEKHHDRKIDAPSGTALALAEAIREVRPNATLNPGRSGNVKRTPEEIGIHSIRLGNIVGEHEILIGTPTQTLTLRHEAHSRALFAEGALAAAAFLFGKPAGLYDMNSMLQKKSGKEIPTI